jgi:SAM-dependent methyltransferase
MTGTEQPHWREFITRAVAEGRLLQVTFSQPRRKDIEARKISIRPLKLKSGLHFQLERLQGNKAYHENVPENAAGERLTQLMGDYRQALFKTREADVQLLANKKGEVTMLRGNPTGKTNEPVTAHNRLKSYVLPEGEPVPFLIRLGVTTPEGRVVKAKYDKFRQINRFLEMVADVLPDLPRGRPLTVVDFGSGKSYLTFALYHMLAIREQLPVKIIGLDLKADVIAECSRLAEDLAWHNLTFSVGDIAEYEGESSVDMVVTLHACDTATDAALLKAISWNASVILSVPCCQHELFRQISQPTLKPLLKHGILKERFSALVTDALRANLLETAGYRTQMLEFIDLEHTPKNLLIRAVQGPAGENRTTVWNEYQRLRDFFGVSPYMEKELLKMNPRP